VAAERGGVRGRIGLLGKAAVLATALLLGSPISAPVAAQTTEQEQGAKPPTRKANPPKADKAAKPRTPPSPKAADKTADAPTADRAPTKQTKKLDPANIDLLQLGAAQAMQVDPGRLDAKSTSSWAVVGLVEGYGGNLAGAKESLERAIALGERRNKPAAAAAAILLGKVHTIGLGFIRTDASIAASFGGRPSQDTTDSLGRMQQSAKASFEKAIALSKAAGRKDGMASGYAALGNLYTTITEYEDAQAAIGEALALNKGLQRKKEVAANYRALADTHRYDLDQAEVLLKQAIALHEAMGMKEELAADYMKLGAVNKSRGEPYEAERLYKQALALTPRLDQGRLLRDLEQLYRDRDDPGLAAEMQEQSQAVDKERRKDGAGGRLFFSADAGMFQSSVASKQQTEALEKVVPLEKKLGHWVGLATSYALLGMHYGERAKYDEARRAELEGRAEAMLREAIALNQTLGREQAITRCYGELVDIVDRRGNLTEVEATLKHAQALHKKLGTEEEVARLYSSLAYGRSRRGDMAQACDYWRKGAVAYPNDTRLVDALNSNKCTAAP
jgi:tetratricopeptide (TPR) repeat protein